MMQTCEYNKDRDEEQHKLCGGMYLLLNLPSHLPMTKAVRVVAAPRSQKVPQISHRAPRVHDSIDRMYKTPLQLWQGGETSDRQLAEEKQRSFDVVKAQVESEALRAQ